MQHNSSTDIRFKQSCSHMMGRIITEIITILAIEVLCYAKTSDESAPIVHSN